jgi:hypothetical protein
MVYTRPDIAYAVSMVNRYMHNPGKGHWNAVKWILHYVKGSIDLGLVFNINKATSGDVIRFVDSDYGSDLDKGRSISAYIFSLCAGAISWKVSLQSITTLSTAEAEYVAATEDVKKATWLHVLILELGVSQDTTVVFSYSQSTQE